MTLHHHMQSQDLESICPYCSTQLSDKIWNSEFHMENHYKCHSCTCGKKICIKVNFYGSGHDSWRKEMNLSKINSLDDLKKLA